MQPSPIVPYLDIHVYILHPIKRLTTKTKVVKHMAQISTQTKNQKNAVSSKNNTALSTNKVSIRKDNSGVSAVIGVILMVAITVIAAAIIGTFVLGIMGNQPTAPGYSAFSAERLADGSITVKLIAPQGQPVTVTKIINAETGKIIIPVTGDYAALSELMTPYNIALSNPASVPAGSETLSVDGFTLAIVGKTGGATSENVLQTIYVTSTAKATPAP